jgi:hypothetical protein
MYPNLSTGIPIFGGGRLEPMRQQDRAIDWTAPTEAVLRRLLCSDSNSGVLDTLFGERYHLYGAHREADLSGPPGQLVAQLRIEQVPVQSLQWQSSLAAFMDDLHQGFGSLHYAYLASPDNRGHLCHLAL